MSMKCRICVEVLENGYTVELPDIAAMNKAEAAAKKSKGTNSPSSSPYMGDFMKEYMAKSADEVIALIKPALKNLPQTTYDEAFAEAAAEGK
ncbi:MAG: hypothetical protein NUV51_11060 [Sulfuricaulis sp.]|nr:hypothetical protein [Sulfuricaulis sp.]